MFRLADEVTGLSIGDLCARGPLETLTRTDVAQTAIVATSLAAAAALQEILGDCPPATAVAGHSVGELAAMCWAGALDVELTLRLVLERGRLMLRDADASDGTMVAVLGLDATALDDLCSTASARTDATVQVANFNAPGQVVLSGDRAAIAAASGLALQAGARRILPLSVGGPFHSAYMGAAARDFARFVAGVNLRSPRVPIVLNTSAQPATDPDALRHELSGQITQPVQWERSVRMLGELGCQEFLELGPGRVLTGLVRRILPEANAIAAGTPESLREIVSRWQLGVRDWGSGQ
jgi:[acyl-carrier-protein] S-malonyltransferase